MGTTTRVLLHPPTLPSGMSRRQLEVAVVALLTFRQMLQIGPLPDPGTKHVCRWQELRY